MRLPGTRYQEHGWEQVRKLLGHCSLQAFRRLEMHQLLDPGQHATLLDSYTDAVAAALRAGARSARAEAEGNSYGDSVYELSLSLMFELQAQPAFWQAFAAAVAAEHGRSGAFWLDAAAEGVMRKKVNDMYAGLRDKVDADNYIVTTGRDCSPNKIYTYRMLDTAYREIAGLFADWRQHAAQVGDILGRPLDGSPIEVRQMKSIGGCKAEWIIRWSESQERHAGSPGPLHTKSKRFASLKNSPEKIAAMLAEIGDYEELSANMDRADDWQGDAGEAALWLEDYWRVLGESEQNEAAGEDRILPEPEADDDSVAADDAEEEGSDDGAGPPDEFKAHDLAAEQALAGTLSLPPRYLELARAAQEAGSWALRVLSDESLPIRLAVYQKLLGAADDTYPDAWLDPATGELPTLQQLAALDQISMPTLRKRRNEAIDKLYAVNTAPAK
ncbi:MULTISPECIES: hypothetical protein [unclassified Duganella]|uniref:hypothetical protein n=1 Tax=unclassified Duganella TaxID=2636909 RepID=UPI000E34A2E6|nr:MULTISPECIES: hypothetical protein [unclassified Duganella]RFP16350.1 hypothetical protein D0T23_10790 [Duganella sp. BJB475]RFP32489.1 hypothetical protein D0T21_09845 [Duganella sp. BJB476]